MGIDINQPYTTKFGFTLPNVYISFKEERINIYSLIINTFDIKTNSYINIKNYYLEGTYRIYNNNKSTNFYPIEKIYFNTNINLNDIDKSSYILGYNYLKSLYVNYTDMDDISDNIDIPITSNIFNIIDTSNIFNYTSNISDISSNIIENSYNISDISSNIIENSYNISDISSNIIENSSNISDISSNIIENSSNISDISSNIIENSYNISDISSNIIENSYNISDISSNIIENSYNISDISSNIIEN